jgi:hypothetical protein
MGNGFNAFVNYAYSESNEDGVHDTSLDRTMEGYIEIIEMGSVLGGSKLETAVTHNGNGVALCTTSVLQPATDSEFDPIITQINDQLCAPSGGLFGDISYVNVESGVDYSADAIALDNFRDTRQYAAPGSIQPTLAQVDPPVSVVFDSGVNPRVVQTDWTTVVGNNIDAISALFMQQHVYNTYVLDKDTKSGTNMVFTFPTKRFYYDFSALSGPAPGVNEVQGLFQRNLGVNGACDDISAIIYDREERTARGTLAPSPPRPGAAANQMCWEANVVKINGTDLLGSVNATTIGVNYEHGWIDFAFATVVSPVGFTAHQLVAPTEATTVVDVDGVTESLNATYFGLPVVGFAVQSFENGNVAGMLSNYGGNFIHKGQRSIEVSEPPAAP